MKKLVTIIPFVAVISLNIFAEAGRFKIEMLEPVVLVVALVLLLNLTATVYSKTVDYFIWGISGLALLGALSVFVSPVIGQLYLENVIIGLYLGLFMAAFLPQFFKFKPFSYYISKKDYPEVIAKSNQFFKINCIISFIWAALFLISIFLYSLNYSDNSGLQIVFSNLVPIFLLFSIGIPVNIFLPDLLTQIVDGERIIFSSIEETRLAMPYGLNKKLAKGIDTIIQFELTGAEPGINHLVIKNQQCWFVDGPHPDPATIIKSDSTLWLDISNNKISGEKASLNNMYEVEGDASILLVFSDLFAPKSEVDIAKYKPREIKYNYKTFASGAINKIMVFDGGPRTSKFSKTKFMVDNFLDGARKAGAEVEYFKLKDHNIRHCSGCYTCWTKTPGECVYNDDMTLLRKKYLEADLVVFASPLYIFNVTGILKDFMDRLLPILKPYMLIDDKGHSKHPARYPETGVKGFVVFSAAGFPDVDHNFDGLKSMFRLWGSHSDDYHLMGEFFMPASEMIAQPVYAKRKDRIERACQKAGEQVVQEGKIAKEFMQLVSFPGVTNTKFQMQADTFWETLDGKGSYLKDTPVLS